MDNQHIPEPTPTPQASPANPQVPQQVHPTNPQFSQQVPPINPQPAQNPVSIDTSQLFQSDVPVQASEVGPNVVSSDMNTYQALPEEPKSKKRLLVIGSAMTLLLFVATGSGVFLAHRSKNSSAITSTATESGTEQLPSATSPVLTALTQNTELPEQNSATDKKETKKSSNSANTSSSDNKSSTPVSSSKPRTTIKKKSPSKETTVRVGTQVKKTSSSVSKSTGTKVGGANGKVIPTSVTCSKDSRYPYDIASVLISQLSISANAALVGTTGDLTSWVPRSARPASASTNTTAVNNSFKNLGPRSCKILPVSTAGASSWRSESIGFLLLFNETEKGKPYRAGVILAKVGNTWKTESITTATSF